MRFLSRYADMAVPLVLHHRFHRDTFEARALTVLIHASAPEHPRQAERRHLANQQAPSFHE